MDYTDNIFWSLYRGILGLCDDKVTEKNKTLHYFGKRSIGGYMEFVEDKEKNILTYWSNDNKENKHYNVI